MDRTRVPSPAPPIESRLRDALVLALCTYGCLHVLYYIGFEGTWLRLREAVEFTARPPFNHRVLFPLLARALRMLQPDLGFAACYFLTQIVAAGAAFAVIQPLARQFVPAPLAAWSRPLLLVLLLPTFTYWTFYDLGIVFFHAAALLALVRRRWGLYLLAFVIGTLNHENTLVLVPVAVAMRHRTWRIGIAGVGWAAAQLACYAAVRLALAWLLPAESLWQSGKLAYNLSLLGEPQMLAKTFTWVLGWGAVIWTARRRLAPELRIASLVVPQLLLLTVVFGQLNELRQFDAALPVAVVGVLCAFAGRSQEAG